MFFFCVGGGGKGSFNLSPYFSFIYSSRFCPAIRLEVFWCIERPPVRAQLQKAGSPLTFSCRRPFPISPPRLTMLPSLQRGRGFGWENPPSHLPITNTQRKESLCLPTTSRSPPRRRPFRSEPWPSSTRTTPNHSTPRPSKALPGPFRRTPTHALSSPTRPMLPSSFPVLSTTFPSAPQSLSRWAAECPGKECSRRPSMWLGMGLAGSCPTPGSRWSSIAMEHSSCISFRLGVTTLASTLASFPRELTRCLAQPFSESSNRRALAPLKRSRRKLLLKCSFVYIKWCRRQLFQVIGSN